MIVCCALALSSIQEDDMKKFRDCMAKAIQEAPSRETADELKRIMERCDSDVSPNAKPVDGDPHSPAPPPPPPTK